MPPRRNQPVTLARLEAAQALIAYAIVRDGDVYAPYFDRLEREIAAFRAREDTVSRARRYLDEVPLAEALDKRSPPSPAMESDTFIYFFGAGACVKIGQSRDWRARLIQLRTGLPDPIRPLLVLKAAPALERELHRLFQKSRVRGEWFRRGPAIDQYIEANRHQCILRAKKLRTKGGQHP